LKQVIFEKIDCMRSAPLVKDFSILFWH